MKSTRVNILGSSPDRGVVVSTLATYASDKTYVVNAPNVLVKLSLYYLVLNKEKLTAISVFHGVPYYFLGHLDLLMHC